jgi:hypothetical protein
VVVAVVEEEVAVVAEEAVVAEAEAVVAVAVVPPARRRYCRSRHTLQYCPQNEAVQCLLRWVRSSSL